MKLKYRWQSPLGALRLFHENGALTGLYFEGHSPAPKCEEGSVNATVFCPVIEQLEEYFAGDRDHFDVPIEFRGTDFQVKVWSQLQRIPFGQTSSYGAIAEACGRGRAVRAVGAAVGRNPISIIVPCHRVLGSNGSLTGFAGGLDRKRRLLELEQTPTQASRYAESR